MWSVTPRSDCKATEIPDVAARRQARREKRKDVHIRRAVFGRHTPDGQGESRPRLDHGHVSVTPRKWKTLFTTDPLIQLHNYPFGPGMFVGGFNRSDAIPILTPTTSTTSHGFKGRPTTRRARSGWIVWPTRDRSQASGSTTKGDFTIPRVLIVNRKLYPGRGGVRF